MLEENEIVVKPLRLYMENVHGWHIEKLHGSQFQEGLPDLMAFHPRYDMRLIECKVIRNGDIHFTVAQQRKFPTLIAHGAKIWLVAAYDLRKKVELERAYKSLFAPPNLIFYMDPRSRRELLR